MDAKTNNALMNAFNEQKREADEAYMKGEPFLTPEEYDNFFGKGEHKRLEERKETKK